jgi:NADPH:quinone reductase-like Zn-dependent oxidoreductase
LLVQVRATTVNRTDCGYRKAHPFFMRALTGLTRPRRTILGTEFAGVVETVGGGVTTYVPGDRVFGYLEGRFGAHAEYLTVPEDASVGVIPDRLSFEQAAAGTEGAHYALTDLEAAGIGAGSVVLVYGATGAIGSAAVQLTKSAGAEVTAVCSAEHVGLVEALGADRVVDRSKVDFTKDERCYDVVFDAVGKTSFPACRPLLKPHGVFMSTDFGPFPWNPSWALLGRFSKGQRVLIPYPKHNREIVARLRDEMVSGAFTPVLDEHRFTLAEIVDAYRYVETGQKIGNVVIEVA